MSTSSADASRPRYHHGDLRRALVAAAGALVEEQGPAALSLREAARRAGVSHNAPYRHFPDREALLAAVAADGFATLAGCMAAAADDAAPHVRLAAIGRAYVAFALERPGRFALMFGSFIEKGRYKELHEASAAAFSVLNGAVRAELGDAVAAPAATAGAWAVVHGLAHLLIDRQLGPGLLVDGDADRLAEAATGIFLAGLRATAGDEDGKGG